MIESGRLRQQMHALHSTDPTVRREAIHALKTEEQDWSAVSSEAAHSLVEALRNELKNGIKQTFLRQELLVILGNIGPRSEPAVPQLIELLQDGVPDGIREEAATALGKIGKKASPAVDSLVAVLSHCRPTLAVRVILALNSIGGADHKIRGALVDLWRAPDQSQHSQVQVALALCKLKIDVKGMLPFLTRTLIANPDSSLRKAAAEGLGFAGKNDLDVVPSLLASALGDKDDKIKAIAEASLVQHKLTHAKAVQVCAKQLEHSVYAEMALKRCGQLSVAALIEALEDAEPIVREKASRILCGLGELAVEAAPALTDVLRDKNMDVRLAAAKALWNVTKTADSVVPVLVDLLKDNDVKDTSEARRQFLQTVIEALWRIGPPAKAAIPALTKKTKDKNRLVSESAINALKAIAPPVPTKA